MLLKSFALLLVAVALVVAQEQQPTSRQRQLANRRSKLFEEQQQQQQEKVGSAGQRRRLVSKTRVNAGRANDATTATPTTTTTTEAPVIVTEPAFTDFTAFTEASPAETFHEEEEQVVFRPRPAPVQVFEDEERVTLRPFRPSANRRPQQQQPVVVIQQEEEEEPEVQTLPPVRQPQPPRPIAGPTRTRPQQQTISRPVQNFEHQDEPAPALSKPSRTRTSVEREEKPVVETVRRYSFEGDDGSFTFGYENADGSFKEETRGADCIVRGKYGYIDPDGVKREFTYQTGNPCPDKDVAEEEEEDDRPQVPVRRPNTPRPSVDRRPPVVVQQQQDSEDEESDIVLNIPQRINRPVAGPQRTQQRPQQQVVQQQTTAPEPSRRVVPSQATPSIINRPPTPIQSSSTLLDFDAEVQRLSGSLPVQQQQPSRPVPARPAPRPIFNDDDDEDVFVERRPAVQQQQEPPRTGQRSFTSELVFDRNTNQFTTALQQHIPDGEDINIREKLGGFIFNPQTTTTISPIRRVPELSVPQQQQRPATSSIDNDFFNSFGPSVQDQERIRQETEARRQQQEQQRILEEQQRIQEENVRQRQQFAAPQPQAFNPDFAFNQGPAGAGRIQQFSPAPQQQNPFAPGLSAQQFNFRQQAQTPSQQTGSQGRPIPVAQRPTFATGQIDSFLSSLQGRK